MGSVRRVNSRAMRFIPGQARSSRPNAIGAARSSMIGERSQTRCAFSRTRRDLKLISPGNKRPLPRVFRFMLPRFRLPRRIAPPPAAASARPPDATAGRHFSAHHRSAGPWRALDPLLLATSGNRDRVRRQDNVNSALIIVAPRWHSLGLFAAAAADHFAEAAALRERRSGVRPLRLREHDTRTALSATESCQGELSYRSLYVLGASLALATLAMLGVALTF